MKMPLLMKRVLKHIVDEPGRLDMSRWLRTMDVKEDVDSAKCSRPLTQRLRAAPCRTIGCLAGWAITLSQPGRIKQKIWTARRAMLDSPMMDEPKYAAELLGLKREVASRLFYTDYWPIGFDIAFRKAKKSPAKQARILVQRVKHFYKTDGTDGEIARITFT